MCRFSFRIVNVCAVGLTALTVAIFSSRASAAEITCSKVWGSDANPIRIIINSPQWKDRYPSGRRPTPATCREALIKGVIEAGDSAKFDAFLRANHLFLDKLFLWSPGGSVAEAMKIGRLVRKGMLTTKAPDEFSFQKSLPPTGRGFLTGEQAKVLCQGSDCHCASACFLIWAAGVVRDGNALGLHRPSIRSIRFANLPPEHASGSYRFALAEVEKYLGEMEVPRRFIELMIDTSSNDIHWLDLEESWSLKEVPSIAEWIAASCGAMSNSTIGRALKKTVSSRIGGNAGSSRRRPTAPL